MAPVITAISLLGWMGTITPKDAKKKIRSVYNNAKEAVIGHWRIKSKQAPPQFTTGRNSGIVINPNPQSVYTTSFGPPYINDMMNPQSYKSSSLGTAPPPPGPPPHVGPHPNFGRGRRNGPNAMTRLSNGSYGKSGAPAWYVPSTIMAKKAAK